MALRLPKRGAFPFRAGEAPVAVRARTLDRHETTPATTTEAATAAAASAAAAEAAAAAALQEQIMGSVGADAAARGAPRLPRLGASASAFVAAVPGAPHRGSLPPRVGVPRLGAAAPATAAAPAEPGVRVKKARVRGKATATATAAAAAAPATLRERLDAAARARPRRAPAESAFRDEAHEVSVTRTRAHRAETERYIHEALSLGNPDLAQAHTISRKPAKKPPRPPVPAAAAAAAAAGARADAPSYAVPPRHEFDTELVVDMGAERQQKGGSVSERTAGLTSLYVALSARPDFLREVEGRSGGGDASGDLVTLSAEHGGGGGGEFDALDGDAPAIAVRLREILGRAVCNDVWRWHVPRVAVNAEVLRAFLAQRPREPDYMHHACTPAVGEFRARNLPLIERAQWAVRPRVFDNEQPCGRGTKCTVRLVGAVGWIGVADTCGLCLLCQCAEQTTTLLLLVAADPQLHSPLSASDLFFYRESPSEYPISSMFNTRCNVDAPFVPFRLHHYVIEERVVVPGQPPVPHVVRSRSALPMPSDVPGFRAPLR
jgi:hypothetical protein